MLQRHFKPVDDFTIYQITIPARGTDVVCVVLVSGTPSGEQVRPAAVTSANSFTHKGKEGRKD